MNELVTEEQQAEKVKHWIKTHGLSVVMGVTIGLGGFFGWQWWQDQQLEKAATGAVAFSTFIKTLTMEDLDKSLEAFQVLRTAQGNSAYVDYAALYLVQQQVDQGKYEDAEQTLSNMLNTLADTSLREIVALRLARVQIALRRYTEAEYTLTQVTSELNQGISLRMRGIVAYKLGQHKKARTFLEAALSRGMNDNLVIYLLNETSEG